MGLSQSILPELDHEMENTRKSLERIPESRLDWKPHPKSMDFGALATHLSNLPSWAVLAIEKEDFDMAPSGGEAPRAERIHSVSEALRVFDGNVSEARAAIAGASDERLMGPWSLLKGGETVFTLPRIAVIRTMVLNHIIHHRGQLGVYLRIQAVPLPALYGPSADEME